MPEQGLGSLGVVEPPHVVIACEGDDRVILPAPPELVRDEGAQGVVRVAESPVHLPDVREGEAPLRGLRHLEIRPAVVRRDKVGAVVRGGEHQDENLLAAPPRLLKAVLREAEHEAVRNAPGAGLRLGIGVLDSVLVIDLVEAEEGEELADVAPGGGA